jgi:large subunit ribosomal protein L25
MPVRGISRNPAKVYRPNRIQAIMANLLSVEPRKKFGKRNNNRLHREGKLPAVLYGHGEEAVSLTLGADQLEAVVRHGAKVVDLEGAASGKALLQDVQWDTFFHQILHVDLLRVKAGDKVTVEVPIELKGEAPGANDGGIIEQLIHSVEIEVPLDLVPEKLHIRIGALQVGGELAIKDISDLPAGATVNADPDEVVVHCLLPVAEEEETTAEEGTGAEPEVIAKGKEKEEGEEGGAEEKE